MRVMIKDHDDLLIVLEVSEVVAAYGDLHVTASDGRVWVVDVGSRDKANSLAQKLIESGWVKLTDWVAAPVED